LRRFHFLGADFVTGNANHYSTPRFSMSPCESSFDSRNSLKRFPITMIASLVTSNQRASCEFVEIFACYTKQ
jgi:hypothetical protein